MLYKDAYKTSALSPIVSSASITVRFNTLVTHSIFQAIQFTIIHYSCSANLRLFTFNKDS